MKVWPGTTDIRALEAQTELQRKMNERGFPAPAVLTRPLTLGPGWAVAMEYNRRGVATDALRVGVRHIMAAGLAHFITEAEGFRFDGIPQRPLPVEGVIWPKPHNVLFDFEATQKGAEWIDDIARQALAIMRSADSRIAVGHCDWSAKNMRMHESGIAVVYDWDSVFVDYETIVLGAAAAHFPVTWELDVPETPSVDAMVAFMRDYEQARGSTFTYSELAEIEAGVTYARAYKARCEQAIDPESVRWRGSSRESLQSNGPFHL